MFLLLTFVLGFGTAMGGPIFDAADAWPLYGLWLRTVWGLFNLITW
jgi:hypothetical protein